MQLTYNAEPAVGRAGMLADARIAKHTMSKLASGPIKAGLGVFIVPGLNNGPGTFPDPSPGRAYQNPDPAVAADTDGIHTSEPTADAGVTILAAGADGVVGDNDMFPPRKLTVTLDAHADWDADPVGLVLTFVNDDLETVTETFAVPNGGATTLTTTGFATRFVSAAFTALSMAGAGGTFTIGIAALDASITLADFLGVALYDAATVESAHPLTTTGEYVDGSTVPVLRTGAVWVETEDTCVEGGAVFVRVASGAGGSQLGSFRSDADGGSAVAVTSARWARNSTATGLNVLEFYA